MTCSYRGGFFTASPGDPDLSALAAAGNSVSSTVLPPDAAAFLVARPAEALWSARPRARAWAYTSATSSRAHTR